jgi:hypothetical protein
MLNEERDFALTLGLAYLHTKQRETTFGLQKVIWLCIVALRDGSLLAEGGLPFW